MDVDIEERYPFPASASGGKAVPFDPLQVEHIGVTLAIALLEQPIVPLPPLTSFTDGGVYALYYTGPNVAYAGLAGLNASSVVYPVYIGKAVRESAKQGFNPRQTSKTPLYNRLSDHASSITQASGSLQLSDFSCRYLQLNDAYISLAESVLITTFRPPWNGMGFGSKVVGGPRMSGKGSLWDALHPGRPGRPAGTSLQQAAAHKKIADCQKLLATPPGNPVVAKMLNKIMKFT